MLLNLPTEFVKKLWLKENGLFQLNLIDKLKEKCGPITPVYTSQIRKAIAHGLQVCFVN